MCVRSVKKRSTRHAHAQSHCASQYVRRDDRIAINTTVSMPRMLFYTAYAWPTCCSSLPVSYALAVTTTSLPSRTTSLSVSHVILSIVLPMVLMMMMMMARMAMRLTMRNILQTSMALLIMELMVVMSMAKAELLRSTPIIMKMLMCRR